MTARDPEAQRAAWRRYAASPHGREQRRRWRNSAAGRRKRLEVERRYDQDRYAAVARIKLERGCVDCGYAEHPAALQFDHVRGAKLEAVSILVGRRVPWSVVMAEIAKCEVRCANCHAVRTAERGQSGSRPNAGGVGTDAEPEGPAQLSMLTGEVTA